MSDITITNGLPADSPWTLANTDTSKLDQTNLINLAVGQLALLGASQGQILQVQTGKLKELVGGVDKVNAQLDFLSNVNSTPSLWSGNPTNLAFPANSVGWIPPATLSSSDLNFIKQLEDVTNELVNANVQFGGYDGIKYSLTTNGITKLYLSLRPITGIADDDFSGTFNLSRIQPDDSTINTFAARDGQIFQLRNFSGKTAVYAYISGSLVKLNSMPTGGFVIPNSASELLNWQIQMPAGTGSLSSVQMAIKNSQLLNSNDELAPNTLPAPEPAVDPPPSNAVTMAINTSVDFNMAEYTLSGNVKFYASYPPTQVSDFSSIMVPENIGKVFQSGALTSLVTRDSYGKVTRIDVTNIGISFSYKPTPDQIINWKGQYAEKIIVITQRSSDQQLFVNRLAQKYQYAFDAATYVLKAFTSALSSAANNI